MTTYSKIKTIIIEDDKESQEYLTSILKNYSNSIEICGYSSSIKKSITLINEIEPELIFMDFEIFKYISFFNFEVIFVTAFDSYIKRAIDHYAFSFILKPIDPNKIIAIVNRYVNLKKRLFSINKLNALSNFIIHKNCNILLHLGLTHISLNINEVIKCNAEGNYTSFVLKNGKSYLASNSLKYYQSLLIEKGFFRANRSCLINIDHIESIYKKETIILTNKHKVMVSVRNKINLTKLISLLS